MSAMHVPEPPVVLDRREGPYGEVVLRRHGELLQIIANGTFLMDTSDGRSERLLVDAARDALAPGRDRDGARPSVLIGGLGVGFSLVHAVADPFWGSVAVVEREPAIIDWHRSGPLRDLTCEALADPRARIVEADLVPYVDETRDTFDALCLDIDNGPGWTVTDGNESLYSAAGLAACRRRLNPGGVLAVWSAQPSAIFEETLRNAGFTRVRTEEIPVVRGVPDVVHLAARGA
ncbi:spermidine synthase family protein [Streptomyces beihaiensis]|uniref:Spermidine synthase n=1 Tax=Streptomyces beihaiensis TaxID=2984495 RepID=A0ABT3U3E6_9ACTN|nr:spermidine synthase [Streptomyces beihaiensis]MCX3063847.1 spermidine synthase [Streptomyces beihaiensis]